MYIHTYIHSTYIGSAEPSLWCTYLVLWCNVMVRETTGTYVPNQTVVQRGWEFPQWEVGVGCQLVLVQLCIQVPTVRRNTILSGWVIGCLLCDAKGLLQQVLSLRTDKCFLTMGIVVANCLVATTLDSRSHSGRPTPHPTSRDASLAQQRSTTKLRNTTKGLGRITPNRPTGIGK